MAENRGGDRPTAPQNNYAVSANGGAGNSGKQPVRYAQGIDNAEDFVAQQGSAPMNKSGVDVPTGRGGAGAPVMPEITPLTAPTSYPNEPVSNGAPMGPGAGPEVLSTPSILNMQNNEDIQRIAAYLPIYARIAEQPTTSNATRNFYRWLRSQI